MGENNVFQNCHRIVLGSPQTIKNNEFLFKKTLLKCVGLTKFLRAINHATEDLQKTLLILQIWFVQSTMPRRIYSIENIACCIATAKWKERGRERKGSDGGNSTGQEETEKQKSNGNPGWQYGGNMTHVMICYNPQCITD